MRAWKAEDFQGLQMTPIAGPAWENVKSAAADEPRVALQINTLVGTCLSGTRVTLDTLVAFAFEPFMPRGLPVFASDVFERRYAVLEEYLVAEDLLFEQTMLISGAQFSEDVALEPGLAVVQIPATDPVLQSPMPDIAPTFLTYGIGSPFGIRGTVRFRKRIGDQQLGEPEELLAERQAKEQDAEELRDRFFDALSLVNSANVQVSRPIFRCLSLDFGLGGPLPIGAAIVAFPRFSIDDGRDLSTFWSALKTNRQKAVDLAVRRLAYAMERKRPEDRLIDLMIAAEAVLLSDMNPELRFRFALRGAWFVTSDPHRRRRCFDFLKRAYDVRSAIAHGGTPKKEMLRFEGVQGTVADVAAQMEHFVRQILRRAVRGAEPGDILPRKWDDDIVGPL